MTDFTNVTTSSIPVANLSPNYINGFVLDYATTTALTVEAGQCKDSTNVWDIVLSANATLSGAVNGVNGLDTGTLGASTLYAVYAIADSTKYHATATLLSTSATAPYLPFGYDIFRRIGWARTDGSSHFLKFYETPSRKYTWDAPISVLSGGTSSTYAAIDLSAAIPPINKCSIDLQVSYTPAVAANTAVIRPSGSASTTSLVISGVVAAKVQDMYAQSLALLISSVPKIDYVVTSSDSLSLSVISFMDQV
jgi:hypothetical protein